MKYRVSQRESSSQKETEDRMKKVYRKLHFRESNAVV